MPISQINIVGFKDCHSWNMSGSFDFIIILINNIKPS